MPACRRRCRRTPQNAVTAVLGLAIAVSLPGCTADTTDSQATGAGPTSTAVSSTPATSQPTRSRATASTATSSTTTSEPSPTRTSKPAPPTSPVTPTVTSPRRPDERARAALVTAEDLPGFTDVFSWASQRVTTGPGTRPPPGCSRSSLISIGGVEEARSVYEAADSDDAYAVQVTAVFPDEQTAITAESVLMAWHDQCRQQLASKQDVRVSPAIPVRTDVGAGTRWLSSYRPVPGDPGALWMHAEGFVRDGDRVSYLVLAAAAPAHAAGHHEPPMEGAIEIAAAYLAASG